MNRPNNGSDESGTARPIVLLAALILALPLLALAWWGASKAFDSTSTSHYVAGQPVDLDTGGVDVEIREAAVTTVTIDTVSTYFIDKPNFRHTIADGVLEVKADCGSAWTLTTCGTDMTVLVPRGTDISLDGGNGDVGLFDLTGKVAVKSDNGDVSGLGLRGADLLAVTSKGDVSLDLADAPSRLDVATDTGDIDVVVPRAHYAVDLKGDNGDVEANGLTNDASSERSIRMVSELGDISLRGVS